MSMILTGRLPGGVRKRWARVLTTRCGCCGDTRTGGLRRGRSRPSIQVWRRFTPTAPTGSTSRTLSKKERGQRDANFAALSFPVSTYWAKRAYEERPQRWALPLKSKWIHALGSSVMPASNMLGDRPTLWTKLQRWALHKKSYLHIKSFGCTKSPSNFSVLIAVYLTNES